MDSQRPGVLSEIARSANKPRTGIPFRSPEPDPTSTTRHVPAPVGATYAMIE